MLGARVKVSVKDEVLSTAQRTHCSNSSGLTSIATTIRLNSPHPRTFEVATDPGGYKDWGKVRSGERTASQQC